MNDPTPIVDSIPQLEPDIPAEAFAADNFLMLVIVGLASAALLTGLALLLWSAYRRKCAASPLPSPEAIALTELARLEAELPPLRPCALQLSLILRRFLAGQAQDPALYETHEEFSLRIDSLASLPHNCQADMRDLLETLAEQKYTAAATQDNPQLARQLIERARDIVQRITTEQAKQAAELAQES